MGLDMYLTARRYLGDHDEEEKTIKKRLSSMAPFKGLDIKEVVAQVGYWRKANHIHKWFVANCQGGTDDCREAYVSREKLNELKCACEAVIKDHKEGKKILPTANGFFFGSTDYDEYYFKGLEETVKIIEKALRVDDTQWELYYHSSW
jgi:hypothetical protein